MGVDGDLLDEDGVFIEEVAGGCLCCVAAPAFTVGLNRLIRQYRPDRILIEPSGLGHPAQVIETLNSVIYQDVLTVEATICVMDARHLSSARHREHPNFIDQIYLSDVLIANKVDQYSAQDEDDFLKFAASLTPAKKHIALVEQGNIPVNYLFSHADSRQAAFPEAHAFLVGQQQTEETSDNPWLIAEGFSDDYYRLGWRIDEATELNKEGVIDWLNKLSIDRVKAIIKTPQGDISYNRSETDSEITALNHLATHTKVQLIHHKAIDKELLDKQLRTLIENG